MLPSSIIDFHVHLFPEKGFDAIWQYFASQGMPVRYPYYSGQCLDYLTRQGVGVIVFSNYAHKPGIAEPMNEWNLRILDQCPNLYCFAAYHPEDVNALTAAERMLSHPRVIGIKLHFQVQQIYPHDERLFPLYEIIIERRKRVLLHVGNGPQGNAFVGFDHFKKVLDRYPDLPANIPHMGGFEFKPFLELTDEHPQLYLDTAYSFWPNLPFTFNLGPEYLERYQDHIIYGSDFPNIILPREGEIETLLSLKLSEEFYQKIFYVNGLKLLTEACPPALEGLKVSQSPRPIPTRTTGRYGCI
jgi:predicted TIM-barrel fold metal-dependent hydrolase